MLSSLAIAVDLDMRSSVRLVMPDELVDGMNRVAMGREVDTHAVTRDEYPREHGPVSPLDLVLLIHREIPSGGR